MRNTHIIQKTLLFFDISGQTLPLPIMATFLATSPKTSYSPRLVKT